MRKTPRYVDPEDLKVIRHLIAHHEEYDMPMFSDSGDGYPEVVEVFEDHVRVTELLGGSVHYVRDCYADGTIDSHREVAED